MESFENEGIHEIDAIILALTSRPSPKGTPGAKRLATAVMRAWNIDCASMMTIPTGDRLASPKVSRKWGISNEKHRYVAANDVEAPAGIAAEASRLDVLPGPFINRRAG
jgi:hypothetical protein